MFCEEQAQACELRAAQLGDRARQDWLTMAEDWRAAATEPEPPYSPVGAGGADRSIC